MIVNIHDAKTHFSKLINQALEGNEVIIAKGGKPMIRLVPYVNEPGIRQGGQFRGLLTISEDFNAPLPDDLLKLFHGDEK